MSRTALLLALLVLAATACLPNTERALAVQLTQQLAQAHGQLIQQPGAPQKPCDRAGDVRAALFREEGEGGLDPTVWKELRQANDALMAACGQYRLLNSPPSDTVVAQQARLRWEAGARESLRLMCAYLQQVAPRLNQPTPACES